jgi:penicillin-binding protein 1A
MDGKLPADEPTPPLDARPRPRPALRPRGKLRWLRNLLVIGFTLVVVSLAAAGIVAFGAYKRFAADLPTVDGLRHYQPRVLSRVYAGNSSLIAELATERRIFVPFTAIPDLVKQAFVSAEDQKFWTHNGVDPMAIARAGWMDFQQMGHGRRPVGASTITQQLAKNMLLGNNEVSLARKAKEAILAMRIEATLPKERILELYLNEIYLGLQSYGVAAAAQTYFNKSLEDLTVPEAAFLAALPKAPNNYNPTRFYEAARARRDWVIDRMADDHVVTAEEGIAAKATAITTSMFRRPETVANADWFGEEVRRQLIDRFGADQATQGGLAVHTSFDPVLQSAADRALRAGLMAYDEKHGGWRGPVTHLDAGPALRSNWSSRLSVLARPPGMLRDWKLAVVLDLTGDEAKMGWLDAATAGTARTSSIMLGDSWWARGTHGGNLGPVPRKMADIVQVGDVVMAEMPSSKGVARTDRMLLRQIPQIQGALVSLDPASGRVLAMSGGWSFENSQFNRATQANRQPGSSFKPMVYLTAMEQNISPSQKVLDAPFVLDQGAAGQWRPGNYETGYAGPIALRLALERSLNLVTVRLAQKVGMAAVADNAIAFHVVDQMSHFLPNALGAVDTTVMRQAGAYAGLSQGGREVMPTLMDSVQDRDGHVIWRAPGQSCDCGDPLQLPQLTDERKQIADPQSVYQVVAMMQGVVSRGTGTEAGKGLGRAIAGKTGTTQDFYDAWFVGFTPDLVTAVWVGFDNPASLGDKQTGGTIAAPIWHDYMAAALADRPKLTFRVPEDITLATWRAGVTDGFKPGQVPGLSGPTIGGGDIDPGVTASSSGTGVDSGMGGLY